jgi:hypothetical protein
VTHWLNGRKNDQWSATLESLDPENQSLWRIPKRAMRVPTPSPLVTRGESLSQTLRTDTLETQFLPLADFPFQAVIEIVDVA